MIEVISPRKLKVFLVELAMGWACRKHSIALDPNWKLPKLRYKGAQVLPQRLRLDRKPVRPPLPPLWKNGCILSISP